jgi:hypothetical protein
LHPEAYGLPLDRSVNHVSDKKENNWKSNAPLSFGAVRSSDLTVFSKF